MVTIALASALVLCTMAVAPAMAATPPTPYVIQGYVFFEDGSECNAPAVEVMNQNTGAKWEAENDTATNYYELVLANGTDVNVSEVLQFDAKDPNATQFNTTSRTVTQTELNNGGLFDFNITLHPPAKPDLIISEIWCELLREGKKANTYSIYYNITNIGGADASRIVSNLTVDGNATKKKSIVKSLAAGSTTTGSFTYRSATPPYTIKVCADWWDRIEESNETNNCLEVTDVTCTGG